MEEKKSLKEIYQKFSQASQKTSDMIAVFVGSWWFVLFFALLVIVWISVNSYFLLVHFDPYPFILLNLTLSCLAAVQAPLIMMSQNREMERDRKKVEIDFLVNQRAEKKIEEIEEDINEIKQLIRKDTVETRKSQRGREGAGQERP